MANWGYKGIIKTSSTPFLFRASRPLLIDGFPYRIASCIGTDTFACTLSLNFSDKTIRGEPSFHQIFLYAWADFFGLVLRMTPLTKKVLNHLGRSITLSSIKN